MIQPLILGTRPHRRNGIGPPHNPRPNFRPPIFPGYIMPWRTTHTTMRYPGHCIVGFDTWGDEVRVIPSLGVDRIERDRRMLIETYFGPRSATAVERILDYVNRI